jgi:hypothetical protein
MMRLANGSLSVEFGAAGPMPMSMSMSYVSGGLVFGGAPAGAGMAANGEPCDWELAADEAGLPLRLVYDLRHEARRWAVRLEWTLEEHDLRLTLRVAADPEGTLQALDLGPCLVRVDGREGSLWREEWAQKSWDEEMGRGLWTPSLRHSPLVDVAEDPDPAPTLYCCWYDADKLCVGLRSNQRYLPLRNRVQPRGYEMGLGPYQCRVRGRALQPLEARLAFLPDVNGDGRADESDYQLWVNRQLPSPESPYREAIWYKIYCGDPGRGPTTTLAQAREIVRRVHSYTDGVPQIAHLVGWQYDGHDSGYPSIAKFNESLGTRDELWKLHEECKRDFNTTLTYHINLDDSYPGHPGWDPEVICRERGGELMRWEVFNDQMSFHINHTKDVESGKVFRKLEEMMEEVPLGGAIHIDAFRNMNWSWEPEGLIGPVEELECGVKPIVAWLRERGIDVSTESADHSAADWFGVVSAILHVGRPRDLVQLAHGKMLYGGRFWPPSVWGYGLGTSINWDVIYGRQAIDWYGCEWWPLLLDGVYLGTLLYQRYLQSEMTCCHLDDEAARLRFADGMETFVRRDNTRLLVTQGDVVVADDSERFVPLGDAIYAYSVDGCTRRWVLPEGFRGRALWSKELGDEAELNEVLVAGDGLELRLRPRVPVKTVRTS